MTQSNDLSKKKILIVEPSPFRRDETYILGPYGRFKAWWIAHSICTRHPYAEVRVETATCTVLRGDEILYSGKRRDSYETNLPAPQPESTPDPRVPEKNEHAERSGSPGATAPQG